MDDMKSLFERILMNLPLIKWAHRTLFSRASIDPTIQIYLHSIFHQVGGNWNSGFVGSDNH